MELDSDAIYEGYLTSVMRRADLLSSVPEKYQTDQICLVAVIQDADTFVHIKNKTPEICLEAVKINGYALEHIENQTLEICLTAISINTGALQFVKNQTPEICLHAVLINGYSLNHVRDMHALAKIISYTQINSVIEGKNVLLNDILISKFNELKKLKSKLEMIDDAVASVHQNEPSKRKSRVKI